MRDTMNRAKAFHPAVKGSQVQAFFFTRYDIGEVEIRRGLDTCYATIAMYDAKSYMPSNFVYANNSLHDTFTIYKLLPIRDKLKLFCSLPMDDSLRPILTSALVTDAADEIKVFTKYARSKTFKMIKVALGMDGRSALEALHLVPWLTTLNAIRDYDFSAFCGCEEPPRPPNTEASAAIRLTGTQQETSSIFFSTEDIRASIVAYDNLPMLEEEEEDDPTLTAPVSPQQSQERVMRTISQAQTQSTTPSVDRKVSSALSTLSNLINTATTLQAIENPQLQALARVLLLICIMASNGDVQCVYDHVMAVSHYILAKYLPDFPFTAFKAMHAHFVATRQSTIVGDGTDPLQLHKMGFCFNHWIKIQSSVLEDSNMICPFYVGGMQFREKLENLEDPAEFDRVVKFLTESPVFFLSDANTKPLYPAGKTAPSSSSQAGTAGAAKESAFHVRGHIIS
jgi:hypothetical protein